MNWAGECFVPGKGDSGRWSRRTSTLASRVECPGRFGAGSCRQIRSGPLLIVPLLTSLRFPCGAVAPRSLRSFATLHTTSMSVVGHAAPKSFYRLPAINATGRPALGRRRSRLRNFKAAFFTLAALDDSRLSVSLRARSTLRPAAAAESAKRQRISSEN